MPRRKSFAATAADSTPGPKKAVHKRQLSANASPAVGTPGSRASKRLRDSASKAPASATPKKSKYFDSGSSDEVDVDETTSNDAEVSGYEDEEVEVEDSPSQEASEEEYDSEEDAKPRRRKTGKKASGASSSTGANSQLWREGVKAGLGPGKQVFIAKPKPRGDGGIKYLPERIHPNTMLFLADLKANNDREWFKMHDPDYRQSWKDWESTVEALTEKISEVDETIPELPPKDLVFRIYRDIRFSPDPTPYKPHFSAAWSRTGRKGPYACYYVQISPHGQSFVGSGLWMPEAQPLSLLRRDIDRKPERLRRVLTDPAMRKHILGGVPNDEKKAIKAFAAQNASNALKTKPKRNYFAIIPQNVTTCDGQGATQAALAAEGQPSNLQMC
ncbi:uncharacterized protein HMPREF1541_04402 [Cyphellophora europaea CBS 101466]|uniref:TIGR02453 family protein n=1 Tax=Cyphellophora europaea (strain CBS 101466) TaxID=1220924 RepID=W2RUK1_CYPE1|nr:uncharacterized protein HMPREF1541_04402 [Cyphellophora europaea CBS 101466]ETN40127.1 hypothetical protein HMPREF1541_04402 [Cyphellophora europaea CBS 101466]